MRKYKLNSDNNPKLPSDESIEKQKDFGKLFHEYENFTKRPKKPMYKDPKYFLLLVVLLLLAYLVFEVVNKEGENKGKEPIERVND